MKKEKKRGERGKMEERISLTKGEIERMIDAAIEKAVLKTRKEAKEEGKEEKKEYVKIKDFAKVFGMTWTGVYNLIANKKVKAVRLLGARSWRIPVEEIENYRNKTQRVTQKDYLR
ncbi:MAG: helix-turn-helix domain-containing protein [Endomicrobium sp.]|nr:helix-turn-helix domain-containing protein [Endomicrobium sp.]